MNDAAQDPAAARLLQSFALLAAVRRHGSFSAAARELEIDPSPVSHRVRALETDLRLKLFDRSTRKVTPTRAGAVICDAALRSWGDAGRALTAARDLKSKRAIRLSVHSSLAMRWLVPRLPAAAASGLDLWIDVREELVDFGSGDVDAALRFGTGPYPGLHSTHLSRSELQPVGGSGHSAAGVGARLSLDDDRLAILSDSGAERYRTGTTWADYCAALELPPVPMSRVRHFERTDLVLQAAIAGMGVALGGAFSSRTTSRRDCWFRSVDRPRFMPPTGLSRPTNSPALPASSCSAAG